MLSQPKKYFLYMHKKMQNSFLAPIHLKHTYSNVNASLGMILGGSREHSIVVMLFEFFKILDNMDGRLLYICGAMLLVL
jgi:hypothetical protein